MDPSRKMRIKKKTTNAQFDVLVIEMARCPKGKVWNRAKFDAMWKKIAHKVNSIGPPQRSVSEWKKVWSDLKRRTQLKTAEATEPWGTEHPDWLFAANTTNGIESSAAAEHPHTLTEEASFEFGGQQLPHSNVDPIMPEAIVHLQTTFKSEPGSTAAMPPLSMESENRSFNNRTPPPRENQPTAGLLELVLSMTHSMTSLVERQTAVAERQTAALERQASATERQAAAIERQAFATERQAAATHAVLKLLSIQVDNCEKKN